MWNSFYNRWDPRCCFWPHFASAATSLQQLRSSVCDRGDCSGPSRTGSSHIHQTCDTFLQLFLVSLLCNAFNSAALLLFKFKDTVEPAGATFVSLVAFADHHSWPQDLLPLIYLPPQWSLLKLHPMQIFFLITAVPIQINFSWGVS